MENEMDLTPLEAQYAPLWVAVKVTARDEIGQPTRGVLLCKHLSRQMLSHELSNVTEKDVCIFQAMQERKGSTVVI